MAASTTNKLLDQGLFRYGTHDSSTDNTTFDSTKVTLSPSQLIIGGTATTSIKMISSTGSIGPVFTGTFSGGGAIVLTVVNGIIVSKA